MRVIKLFKNLIANLIRGGKKYMLPELNLITDVNSQMPSYTYNINRETNRISGYIDELERLDKKVFG